MSVISLAASFVIAQESSAFLHRGNGSLKNVRARIIRVAVWHDVAMSLSEGELLYL
jgi:hypothetical protein